jgi:hypothetical protein
MEEERSLYKSKTRGGDNRNLALDPQQNLIRRRSAELFRFTAPHRLEITYSKKLLITANYRFDLKVARIVVHPLSCYSQEIFGACLELSSSMRTLSTRVVVLPFPIFSIPYNGSLRDVQISIQLLS